MKAASIVTVTAVTKVSEVLDTLVTYGIGCVFILDAQDRIIGVFSERDVLLKLGVQFADCLDRPVSDFMTENPESISESARIAFAVHKMDIGGYRHLPILDGARKAKGVISVRDILGYVTSKLTGTANSESSN